VVQRLRVQVVVRSRPFTGRPNVFAGTTPFLFEGTLTRTVEDAAVALGVMAGPDPRDPFSLLDKPDFALVLLVLSMGGVSPTAGLRRLSHRVERRRTVAESPFADSRRPVRPSTDKGRHQALAA